MVCNTVNKKKSWPKTSNSMVPLEKQIKSSTLIVSLFFFYMKEKKNDQKQLAKNKKIAYSSDREARGQKK